MTIHSTWGAKEPTGLAARLAETIDGRRRNVDFGPWPSLTGLARALLPGTITVLAGIGGSAKSLMVSQACLWWLECQVPFAVFHLEEDREFHELRALAQLADEARLTDDIWLRNNGPAALDLHRQHQATVTALGRRIWDAPSSDVALPDVTHWVGDRLREGARVVVVDPVTAADPGSEPWAADRRFIIDTKRLLRDAGASMVVVTHPRNADPKQAGRIDNHAGGQAYNRFTQSVLMLGAGPDADKPVIRRTAFGTSRGVETVNRVVRIMKARNGIGAGRDIGFYFDPKTLRFHERGEIVEA